jgi:hypothetical protein
MKNVDKSQPVKRLDELTERRRELLALQRDALTSLDAGAAERGPARSRTREP